MAIRVLPTHSLVLDQLDFFQGDFYTRIVGVEFGDLTFTAFFNNTVLNWPLVDGTGVTNEQVAVGSVYFNEIQAGFYGLRFKPNVQGYWRFDFDYVGGSQVITLDYDILDLATVPGGLKAYFIKPGPGC